MTSPGSLTSGLEVVKSAAPRTVLRGGGRVVKVYRPTTLRDRLKRWLGRSPARREASNLRRAAAAGLPVPAVLEDTSEGPAGEESLAIAEIEGAVPLDTLLGEAGPRRIALTRALGALLRAAQEAGLDHSDLHAGNVLVGPDDSLWLIDLHGARFRTRLGPRARRRGLLAFGRLFLLAGSRTDRLRFLRAYDPDGWRSRARETESALRRSCEVFWRRRRRRYRGSRHVRPLRTGGFRGIALTAFEGADDLPARPGADEEILKAGGRTSTVTAARIGDRDVVIKRYHRKKALSPWLDLARGSRARRGFEKGHALLMRGLPTPEPLAWLDRRDAIGRPVESVLVTARLRGSTGRDAFRDISPEVVRDRLERLGRTVRRLREAGFHHRDLKLDNWLWPDDVEDPVLLDLDGLRRGRASDGRLGDHLARLDRDLESAGVSDDDRAIARRAAEARP